MTGDPWLYYQHPYWTDPGYPQYYTVPSWPNGGAGLDAKIDALIAAMNRLAEALEKHK